MRSSWEKKIFQKVRFYYNSNNSNDYDSSSNNNNMFSKSEALYIELGPNSSIGLSRYRHNNGNRIYLKMLLKFMSKYSWL